MSARARRSSRAEPTKIVVRCPNGHLSRLLVAALAQLPDAPHHVITIGAHSTSPARLRHHLRGALALIDIADVSTTSPPANIHDFAVRTTSTAIAVAESVGLRHLVFVSASMPCRESESQRFSARLAAERLIELSPVPHSIVRTAPVIEELHAMAPTLGNCRSVRGHLLVHPVTARQVASAVATVAVNPATNRIQTIAGTSEYHLQDAVVGIHLDGPQVEDRALLDCGSDLAGQVLQVPFGGGREVRPVI